MDEQRITIQSTASVGQLIRSTAVALVVALGLLVSVVLPSEFAIDPTGVGRIMGLTQMGEIKQQLAQEAEQDVLQVQVQDQNRVAAPVSAVASVVTQAPVSTNVVVAESSQQLSEAPKEALLPKAVVPARAFELILTPGQGAEIKLEMLAGREVQYRWSANGGQLNYDTHADPYQMKKGFYHGYGKGRFQPGDAGVLSAAFDGYHGWFWRNRTERDVVLTLQVEGDFIDAKRLK